MLAIWPPGRQTHAARRGGDGSVGVRLLDERQTARHAGAARGTAVDLTGLGVAGLGVRVAGLHLGVRAGRDDLGLQRFEATSATETGPTGRHLRRHDATQVALDRDEVDRPTLVGRAGHGTNDPAIGPDRPARDTERSEVGWRRWTVSRTARRCRPAPAGCRPDREGGSSRWRAGRRWQPGTPWRRRGPTPGIHGRPAWCRDAPRSTSTGRPPRRRWS